MGEFADALADRAEIEAAPLDPASTESPSPEGPPPSASAPVSPPPAATGAEASVQTHPPSPSATERSRATDGRFAPGTPTPSGDRGDLNVALREAREQGRQLKERFSWLPDPAVDQVRQFFTAYQRDPVGALVEEIRGLMGNPAYADRVRHALGGTAPQAAPTPEAAPAPEPEPDLQTADGTLVYSAPQLAKWHAWRAQQDEAKFEERIKPLQSFVVDQQRRGALAKVQSQATTNAKQWFQEMQQFPHFQPNKDAIKAQFAELTQTGMDARSALYKAYLTVLHTSVLPTLSQTERQAVVSSLHAKQGASSPNPSRTAAAAPGKPFQDFAEWRDAMHERGG